MDSEDINRVKAKLKEFIREIGGELLEEKDLEDRWGFVMKYGNYVVQIVHPKHLRFMVCVFSARFSPEVINDVKELCKDPMKKVEFEFGLVSALTSPVTAYRHHFDDEGYVVGFEVIRKIFPFDESFTIRDFDEAIQSVVSIGVLGLRYLQAVIGARKIEQSISEWIGKPPPESMYI